MSCWSRTFAAARHPGLRVMLLTLCAACSSSPGAGTSKREVANAPRNAFYAWYELNYASAQKAGDAFHTDAELNLTLGAQLSHWAQQLYLVGGYDRVLVSNAVATRSVYGQDHHSEPAVSRQLRRYLEHIAAASDRLDNLWVRLHGHGTAGQCTLSDDLGGHLLPLPAFFRWLLHAIASQQGRLQVGQLVLSIDGCFSGAWMDELWQQARQFDRLPAFPDPLPPQTGPRLAYLPVDALLLLTSATRDQGTWLTHHEGSFFHQALIESLDRAQAHSPGSLISTLIQANDTLHRRGQAPSRPEVQSLVWQRHPMASLLVTQPIQRPEGMGLYLQTQLPRRFGAATPRADAVHKYREVCHITPSSEAPLTFVPLPSTPPSSATLLHPGPLVGLSPNAQVASQKPEHFGWYSHLPDFEMTSLIHEQCVHSNWLEAYGPVAAPAHCAAEVSR